MKTIETEFRCSCGQKPIPISFNKISPYTGATRRHICPTCSSEFILKILKVKDKYKVFVKNEFVSPSLKIHLDRDIKIKEETDKLLADD